MVTGEVSFTGFAVYDPALAVTFTAPVTCTVAAKPGLAAAPSWTRAATGCPKELSVGAVSGLPLAVMLPLTVTPPLAAPGASKMLMLAGPAEFIAVKVPTVMVAPSPLALTLMSGLVILPAVML